MSDSVDNTGPDYSARESAWAMMRAFAAGRDKVLADDSYLTRLPGHDASTYESYTKRAYFFNGTARSIEGFEGLLFRKAPQAEYPPSFDDYRDDLTRSGVSADQFAQRIAGEVLTVARCGVLVDYPTVEVEGTRAQMSGMGARPYASLYTTESILDWDETVIGAEKVLSQVKLQETYLAQDPDDEFKKEPQERIRVLDLFEGAYRVRIYVKDQSKNWALQSEFFPMRNNARMARIPFRFFTPKGSAAKAGKPPLLDLCEANKGHLNDSGLYQWGLMWTANPTPCFVDLKLEEGEAVSLGASKGLMFGEGGNAFFLEFGGQGLGAIRQAMEDKRRDMAVLGARMLMEDRKGVEAAETAAIHKSGENSVLASIAGAVSEGMEWVLGQVAEWAGVTGEVKYAINRDFMPVVMDAQRLTAIVGSWQAGAITKQDLFAALQRGEIIAEEKSFEDHADELEQEPPEIDVA